MVRVIASRTASAPCPESAGPSLACGPSPSPFNRGRCRSIVKRVVRSTSVPIAELPEPTIRSPSQCPGTASLAADRRESLVTLARRWSKLRRIFVLEDAAYRGLTFDGEDPPSVWSYDRSGDTVILARTFSKTFSPGLKTGFGVLPESLVEPILRLKGNHDFGSANFAQILLDRLMENGAYEAQVARLLVVYRRKRDALLGALREHFATFHGTVRWTEPRGGLYVWLTLPEDLDSGPDGSLFSRSVTEGVLYVPGAYAFAGSAGAVPKNHARLCFGAPGENDLVEGVRRLAVALSGCLEAVA